MENTEMNQVVETAVETVAENVEKVCALSSWQAAGVLGGVFVLGAAVGAAVTKLVIKKKAEPKQEKKERKPLFGGLLKKKTSEEPGVVEADSVEELTEE